MSQPKNSNLRINDLIVRPLHPNDIDGLYKLICDCRVARLLPSFPLVEYADVKKEIENPSKGLHRLIAELDNTLVGMANLKQPDNVRLAHSGKINLMVLSDYWDQGIGSALMTHLLDLADNWLGLQRLETEVLAGNKIGMKLIKKFGFNYEGASQSTVYLEGQLHDEIVMARLNGIDSEANKRFKATGNNEPSRTKSVKSAIEDIDIRPLHPDDAQTLYQISKNPRVCRTTLQVPSQELWYTVRKVNMQLPSLHRFVAVVQDRIVGQIALKQNQDPLRSHSAHLAMMVDPEFWGQGIGTKLMETVIDLSDNWLNLKRIDLVVNADNFAGIQLYKKCDFIIEGTKHHHTYGDGRWTDSHFMARLKAFNQ